MASWIVPTGWFDGAMWLVGSCNVADVGMGENLPSGVRRRVVHSTRYSDDLTVDWDTASTTAKDKERASVITITIIWQHWV